MGRFYTSCQRTPLGSAARGRSFVAPDGEGPSLIRERKSQVVRDHRGRGHALVVASCRIRHFAAGEGAASVLAGLTVAGAETAKVVEGVTLDGRVARELGEEAAAACLDGELADDRIFYPHQPGHRVDQHGVGDETVEQEGCIHVEDVVAESATVELAFVVAAGEPGLCSCGR
jgi:hypothetical protein